MSDYIGMTFNNLTIIEEPFRVRLKPANKQKVTKAKCRCKCGTIKICRLAQLKNNTTKSCGCLRKGSRTINVLGQKFGRLLVVESLGSHNHKQNKAQWLCLCDCGNIAIVTTNDLQSGYITSCYRDCQLHQEYKSYVGHKFEKLTILSVDKAVCVYQCECRNIKSIEIRKILSGNTSSCGECNKFYVGEMFGNLEILDYIYNGNKGGKFVCKCVCGNIKIHKCHRILDGHISSCGNCGLLTNGRKTSNPQRKILSMVDGGIENYKTNIGYYIDIVLLDEKIGIEYDEWYWHKDKIDKDLDRIKKLIYNGWKILHIKASGNIPSQELLNNGLEALKNKSYYSIELKGWGKKI